jgi:tetratricopeptide (TPR) repeat protein
MNSINNSVRLKDIIQNLNNKEFNKALVKLEKLSVEYPNDNLLTKLFASIYFQTKKWQNSINYYEKTLPFENEKFKTYNNIGVAFFNLGKINKSIEAFQKSINDKSNFDLAYNNLGISFSELGIYQKAINNFTYAINLNKNNYNAKKNLINLFLVSKPKNINDHPLIKINAQINEIGNKINIKDNIELKEIKKILDECESTLGNIDDDIHFSETQIFRKNSTNLNCNRHFKIFNEFNIIPKYCFACYKIQINLNNVVDLIRLFFIFNNLKLENNNIRKCIVEIRNNIKGNYKGYVYCDGLEDAKKVFHKIENTIEKTKFKKIKIEIKHGCSEFYKSYPNYQNINFEGEQQMKYDENWKEKESIIDMRNPIRADEDKKIFTPSISSINLSDILIIKNWINYASIIGDYSFKKIYNKEIKPSFINNVLQAQLDFRKKDFI